MFKEDIHIANWGRKFAELEFLQTEERLISLLFSTATERYVALLKDNSDLLQRIPLECLASYLGITPVSLSRIRAKMKQIRWKDTVIRRLWYNIVFVYMIKIQRLIFFLLILLLSYSEHVWESDKYILIRGSSKIIFFAVFKKVSQTKVVSTF